jgi:hypothetical protein
MTEVAGSQPARYEENTMIRATVAIACLAVLTLIGSVAGSAAAQGTAARVKEIPANLTPPSGAVLLFELGARGVQIYACEAEPDNTAGFVWTFKAPEAELLNARGEVVGTHFAGPTWQSRDGSAVVSAVLERADAPKAGSIPWLLLGAEQNMNRGVFSTVTYVQRLDTAGGIAPTKGCDADHAGEEVRILYEATYAFYYPAAA